MAKMGNRLKIAMLKGMEAIGKGASNLASNAHLKVSEINLETRRREILSEFPLRAHDLWQKGVELPQPLGDMMSELNDLDERLSVLRAQRYAKVEDAKPEAGQDGAATDENAPAEGESEAAVSGDAAEGALDASDADIAGDAQGVSLDVGNEVEQADNAPEHIENAPEQADNTDDCSGDNPAESCQEPTHDDNAPSEGDNA